jgi:hypothetical protein
MISIQILCLHDSCREFDSYLSKNLQYLILLLILSAAASTPSVNAFSGFTAGTGFGSAPNQPQGFNNILAPKTTFPTQTNFSGLNSNPLQQTFNLGQAQGAEPFEGYHRLKNIQFAYAPYVDQMGNPMSTPSATQLTAAPTLASGFGNQGSST